jgi:SRSO17 transposase
MNVDEERVEAWSGEWAVLEARLARYFGRPEVRERAMRYLKGLLSEVPRKNGWQLAEQAGEATPDGMQRLLSTAVWEAGAVRDELGTYIAEHLGEAEAVLVADETGFPKQGHHSAGVKRQYSGTLGKVANCQVGVFLTYASNRGHALLDRALYLPREWTDDRARCQAAGIPETVTFATKPELARRMIDRARQQGVPFAWVSGDTVYGGDPALRQWLEDHQVAFVLAVAKDDRLGDGTQQERADALAAALPSTAWQRLSCGQGAKGPRLYAWALRVLPRVDQPATHFYALLVRRSLSDGELTYYVVYAPAATPLQRLVNVAGQRWTVEECFELGKDEVGLDQYEVRHWIGWYRHITLAMWALAYLVVTRCRAAQPSPQKKRGRPGSGLAAADGV